MFKFFQKKEPKEELNKVEREARELLRENLNTVSVDMFYADDPIIGLNPNERKQYLSYFHLILKDKKLIERIKFLINTQARMTLKGSKDGVFDIAGAMTMNGITVIKNDIERLSAMFEKEEAESTKKSFNERSI